MKWSKDLDNVIRQVYLKVTGEIVQDLPMCNKENTHNLIGSNKITENKINRIIQELELLGIKDGVDFYLWKLPSDWVHETEGIIKNG